MLNRKHIAIIAIAAAGASAGALATGDAGVRPAERMLEEARGFGVPQITGRAAGQSEVERDRAQRRAVSESNLSVSEVRWREILEQQSLSN